jgi:hypothetical protein
MKSKPPLTAGLETADAESMADQICEVVSAGEKVRIAQFLKVCERHSMGVLKTNGWSLNYYFDVLMKVKRDAMPYRISQDIHSDPWAKISYSYVVNFRINGHTSWANFIMLRVVWANVDMLIRDPGILSHLSPTIALYQVYAQEGSLLERMNNYRG